MPTASPIAKVYGSSHWPSFSVRCWYFEQEVAELDDRAQVVACVNGRNTTRGELALVFDLVADKANWKNPINTLMSWLPDSEDRLLIREAVVFFTGSVPEFSNERGRLRVRAAGYYLTIGA